ncbi:helix-turn-helix transcriptional regulator [Streptomyces californicus]|uniref:helix-turn-helix transcriptional regulator n=1 Tax=Streptomyces californicus TaxID=67351 RepID=UPI0038096B2E
MSTPTALSTREVLALPAMVKAEDAFAALGIGRDLGYRLIRQNKFPVPVVPLGARIVRVRRTDLLAFLGLAETDGGTDA